MPRVPWFYWVRLEVSVLLLFRGEVNTCHCLVPLLPGDGRGVSSIRGCTPGRVCPWKSPCASPGSPAERRTGLRAPRQMSSLSSVLSPESEAMAEKEGPSESSELRCLLSFYKCGN